MKKILSNFHFFLGFVAGIFSVHPESPISFATTFFAFWGLFGLGFWGGKKIGAENK